jgi:hypothetical protein
LWKGPHRSSQKPSSWLTREFSTPTGILEIRYAHVVLLHPPEDIAQRYSKLSKLTRVIAYCRGFINNCRHPKANRQLTTLSTQAFDKALTCCVKMVQQISYAQEIEEFMEQQKVTATSSLKTLHSFINQEGILRVGR